MIMAPDFHAAPKSLVKQLDPDTIRVDALTYQFRRNGDKHGVTRSGIYNTDRWDPLLHGNPILAHERLDGSVFVADGHHRLDLANRANAIGQGPGKIAAFVLREADGYTAKDVRAIAAYINMNKGHFEPIEGAWVIKEVASGRVHTQFLPQMLWDGENIRVSMALSRLSDDALTLIETGRVPVKSALFVVAQNLPPHRQDSVMYMIDEELHKPENRGIEPGCGCATPGGFVEKYARRVNNNTVLAR